MPIARISLLVLYARDPEPAAASFICQKGPTRISGRMLDPYFGAPVTKVTGSRESRVAASYQGLDE
jgi:hypothetical protein